ncbi:hypothetical protein D3C76_1176250 [compost metagenome]
MFSNVRLLSSTKPLDSSWALAKANCMLPAVTARASALHFITCIVIAPLVLKILAASLRFLHSAVANRKELCRIFIGSALHPFIPYVSEALCGWVSIDLFPIPSVTWQLTSNKRAQSPEGKAKFVLARVLRSFQIARDQCQHG